MSLTSIDLYETDGLLLFNSKSIIFQATDLERVIEKAENIFNFYLDFNWEFRFIGVNIRQSAEKKKGIGPFSNSVISQSHIHRPPESMQVRFLPGESVRRSL
jgi:hypothetical protein